MHNYNAITITSVANGYILHMPMQRNDEGPLPGINIGKMIGDMQHAITNDPILQRIENDLNDAEAEAKKELPREMDMHVFKTFKEVIAFLQLAIDE